MDYIFFFITLLSIFKPEIVKILDLNFINDLSSVLIIFSLIYYVYKLNFRIAKRDSEYIKYSILFWAFCVVGTIIFGKNIKGIFALTLKTIDLGLMCIYASKKPDRCYKLIVSSAMFFVGLIILNVFFIFILPDGSFTAPIKNASGEWVYNYLLGPKNNFTTFGLCALFFVSIIDIIKNKNKRKNKKIIVFMVVTLVIYNMYKVNCSTGLLTFLIAAIMLVTNSAILFKNRIFRYILIGCVIIIGVFAVLILDPDVLQELTHSRWMIWMAGLELFINNPILGYGMQLNHDLIYLYGSYRYSHNEIIEILLYGGIPALVIYIYMIYRSFRYKFLNKNVNGAYILFIVLYFIAQIFEAQFTSLYIFYVIFIMQALQRNASLYVNRMESIKCE